MTTVGFIGLGVMGRPMARNLLRAGHDLVVHNRSQDPVEQLVAEGALRAGSPAEVANAASIVITMLPDGSDVTQVVLHDGGVLEGASSGLLLIDMSTIRPQTARTVATEASRQGVRVLDAPVSGGEKGAIEGTLSIMVGGSEEDFQEARPLFDTLGAKAVLVGPSGSGQTVKAANQVVVAGMIALLSEAIVLLEAHGIDPVPALKVLAGGLAGNRVLDTKGEAMLRRDFRPGFRVDLHHKDLRIALDAARENNVVLPVTAVVAQLLIALRAQGCGDLDHGAILMIVDELSGHGSPRVS